MPIEFLSDEAKRKLALYYSTRKASSEKEDFEALLCEIRVLRDVAATLLPHFNRCTDDNETMDSIIERSKRRIDAEAAQ